MRLHATLAVACSLLAAAARGDEPRPLRFEPHVIQGFDGTRRQAELGLLRVPARHAQPAASSIELAVLRLGSTATAPRDPIVFLMGGPGIPASVMAQVPVYAQLFERLRGVADKECAAAWRAKGVDAAAYTSLENAADVTALREALGARHVNLLAFSYGTEVALNVIREHGDGVARAALAGVRGPDQLLKLPSVYDLKLRRISRLASASPALRGALEGGNDLASRVERVLKAAATPFSATVADQRTQQAVELRIGREGLQMLLTQSLDSARFPALVVSLDMGDTRVLSRVLEPLFNGLGRGGSNLMARAVNCTTGASPARAARAAAESRWALLGLPFDDLMVSSAYCRAIGPDPAPDSQIWRPFASDVPTLFVSGSLDSQTPPSQAEEVRYGFANGVHLVVENARHETLPLAAVQDAIVDFFEGKDVSGRRLAAEPMAFLSVEDAANQPCGPRGC